MEAIIERTDAIGLKPKGLYLTQGERVLRDQLVRNGLQDDQAHLLARALSWRKEDDPTGTKAVTESLESALGNDYDNKAAAELLLQVQENRALLDTWVALAREPMKEKWRQLHRDRDSLN